MSDTPEALSYPEALSTLRSWVGRDVRVFLGPAGEPYGGRLWAKLSGTLAESDYGPAWLPEAGQQDAAVAFQVGPDEEGYFVLYADLFRAGYWVSREHGFFVLEMHDTQVGVEAQPSSDS